mmetsp:Transcript_2149/g.5623  ORF Transcript_2149/g.5623 Transcript_2149/m.5623 type:complete len:418 (-) Transcript_2149:26-1279(-)
MYVMSVASPCSRATCELSNSGPKSSSSTGSGSDAAQRRSPSRDHKIRRSSASPSTCLRHQARFLMRTHSDCSRRFSSRLSLGGSSLAASMSSISLDPPNMSSSPFSILLPILSMLSKLLLCSSDSDALAPALATIEGSASVPMSAPSQPRYAVAANCSILDPILSSSFPVGLAGRAGSGPARMPFMLNISSILSDMRSSWSRASLNLGITAAGSSRTVSPWCWCVSRSLQYFMTKRSTFCAREWASAKVTGRPSRNSCGMESWKIWNMSTADADTPDAAIASQSVSRSRAMHSPSISAKRLVWSSIHASTHLSNIASKPLRMSSASPRCLQSGGSHCFTRSWRESRPRQSSTAGALRVWKLSTTASTVSRQQRQYSSTATLAASGSTPWKPGAYRFTSASTSSASCPTRLTHSSTEG